MWENEIHFQASSDLVLGFCLIFSLSITQNAENEMSSLNFCMALKVRWGATEVEYISCYESIECF